MKIRILDLDGSLTEQTGLLARCTPTLVPLHDWGPSLRLACSCARFAVFQQALAERLSVAEDKQPTLTFIGSGDFHHVSLALLRRLRTPFNLLVIDNHPDWMRGVPLLHCGTWLWHAAQMPLARHIFHVGGDVDFDNYYRWLAPWPLLRSGRIHVFPARRCYRRWPWGHLATPPLRLQAEVPMTPERIMELVQPFRAELVRWPLYISLDKDVLTTAEAVVNWDSGHLNLAEVLAVVAAFTAAATGNLAGMDIVGDWSPVQVVGGLRQMLHWTEHPRLEIDAEQAARQNERTNLVLLDNLAGDELSFRVR